MGVNVGELSNEAFVQFVMGVPEEKDRLRLFKLGTSTQQKAFKKYLGEGVVELVSLHSEVNKFV